MPRVASKQGSRCSDTLKVTRLQTGSYESGLKAARLLWSHATQRDAHSIGWLPWAAFDDAAAKGRIITLHNNDDLVGFLVWSVNALREVRCVQVWVRADARLILHGRALVEELERIAAENGCWIMRLWCGEDLAANLFWGALGFTKRNWRRGRTDRRRHVLWVRRVNARACVRGAAWLKSRSAPASPQEAEPGQ
jgi:GNAT superfamily N-acetyltransferase